MERSLLPSVTGESQDIVYPEERSLWAKPRHHGGEADKQYSKPPWAYAGAVPNFSEVHLAGVPCSSTGLRTFTAALLTL